MDISNPEGAAKTEVVRALTRARDLATARWLEGFCPIQSLMQEVKGFPYLGYTASWFFCRSIIDPPAETVTITEAVLWIKDPDRTQVEVLAVFDKAIERVKGTSHRTMMIFWSGAKWAACLDGWREGELSYARPQ